MNGNEYTAVIGVRRHKSTHNAHNRYSICKVPEGCIVNNGTMVFYGNDTGTDFDKGICVSDTLFVDRKTLELICMVTSTLGDIPEVKALINLEWIGTSNNRTKEMEGCY